MSVFTKIESIRKNRGACVLALIDPDSKNDKKLKYIIEAVIESDFDAILVGGSLLMDNQFEERMAFIKALTTLPIIIFPGSSRQLSKYADGVLFLSLLSGRNPQYLIGEQVQSAPIMYSLGIESIPTGYILLDGGTPSSVQVMSHTFPLPMAKKEIILAHALAGQYLGMKVIFLEAGSGADNHASADLVKYVTKKLTIPMIVGGGIQTKESASELVKAGAGYLVIGTLLEQTRNVELLSSITSAAHYQET